MIEYDTIVVGSGVGGAMAAHELVGAGERVLMLERGAKVARSVTGWRPEATSELTEHYWPDAAVRPDGRPIGVHSCVGGPSVFFGAVALRLRADDFSHAAEMGDSAGRWPFGYDELEPFYTRAERLLDVAGKDRADPLEPPRSGPYPQPPAERSAVAGRIGDAARHSGLRPFELPLAINYRQTDTSRAACVRCSTCDTFACAIGAKNDVESQVLVPLVGRGLHLRPQTIATRLVIEDGRVVGVRVHARRTGAESTLRARRVVLAAGALGSAHLALASRLDRLSPAPAAVGAYLTRHCSAMVYGVFARRLQDRASFHKQLGFHDLYLGDDDAPIDGRIGALQQAATPPSTLVEEHLPWRLGALLRPVVARMTGLLAMAEDQPRVGNRVRLGAGLDARGLPPLVVEHRHSPRDLAAREHLVTVARRVLRRAGALGCYVHQIDTFSHASGTLRMGTDPRASVLDSDGRFRGVENLYVTDASALPTGGAVNPSLTIAANALRVSSALAAQSRSEVTRAAA